MDNIDDPQFRDNIKLSKKAKEILKEKDDDLKFID